MTERFIEGRVTYLSLVSFREYKSSKATQRIGRVMGCLTACQESFPSGPHCCKKSHAWSRRGSLAHREVTPLFWMSLYTMIFTGPLWAHVPRTYLPAKLHSSIRNCPREKFWKPGKKWTVISYFIQFTIFWTSVLQEQKYSHPEYLRSGDWTSGQWLTVYQNRFKN